jgi:predicted metal-dependent HD superfamily phosphohydrolase
MTSVVVTRSDEEDAVVARLQQATSLRSNGSFDAYPSLQDELRFHWDLGAAVPSSSAATSTQGCWFDRIYRQHNEAGRYYHTAVHLKEMLDYLQRLSPQEEPMLDDSVRSLRLAIFFHDVVYDPQSNRNEKDSAKLFEVFCNESKDDFSILPTTTIQNQVVTLILATEAHQVIPGTDESLQKIFLDLDMAVLGKDSKAYLAYAALIRKEYSFVPRQVYCEKRAEILQGFLQKPRIYLSPPFHRALEEAARRNLQEELNLLQKGVIPGETEGK